MQPSKKALHFKGSENGYPKFGQKLGQVSRLINDVIGFINRELVGRCECIGFKCGRLTTSPWLV